MGCLCYKTFAKIVEFDVNGKKIKSKDMYKTICGSNRQPKKKTRVKDYPSLDKATKSTKTD